MTPHNHIWGWAKTLHVDEMDTFIAEHQDHSLQAIYINYKGETKSHLLGDVMEAVRYCREEYRKDQRMTNSIEEEGA